MSDEDEDDEMIEVITEKEITIDHPVFEDSVAERIYAFSLLMQATSTVEDEAIRELGLNMMQAVIRVVGGPNNSVLSVAKK
jgi:hypothetical protein